MSKVFKKFSKKQLALALMVGLMVVSAVPTFAQTATLNLSTELIQNNLFSGANIIIGALGAIVFLLAGFSFGGRILRSIGDWVTNFRF